MPDCVTAHVGVRLFVVCMCACMPVYISILDVWGRSQCPQRRLYVEASHTLTPSSFISSTMAHTLCGEKPLFLRSYASLITKVAAHGNAHHIT
ncbi:hypothetical protein EVAR_11703_1 [Eumeta japonica]|uniref:Uncharacterized protein n=1 Tax=Eumeta variegata TaxID=151549 RepID=A0A4C1U4X0_EUMVA|nr:hypothetical protein EVAR_11703_1 [Eumeta japonica]